MFWGHRKFWPVFVAVREGVGEVVFDSYFKELLNCHSGKEEHENSMHKGSETRRPV